MNEWQKSIAISIGETKTPTPINFGFSQISPYIGWTWTIIIFHTDVLNSKKHSEQNMLLLYINIFQLFFMGSSSENRWLVHFLATQV